MMCSILVALATLASGCASSKAPQASDAPAKPPLTSVWSGYGSPEDRTAIRACLDRERAEGDVGKCVGVRGASPPTLPPKRTTIMAPPVSSAGSRSTPGSR